MIAFPQLGLMLVLRSQRAKNRNNAINLRKTFLKSPAIIIIRRATTPKIIPS